MWVQVVRDPRVGAFHMFSGLELKIMEDPVGKGTELMRALGWVYEKVRGWLPPGLLPSLGGWVEGPVPQAGGSGSGRKKEE